MNCDKIINKKFCINRITDRENLHSVRGVSPRDESRCAACTLDILFGKH